MRYELLCSRCGASASNFDAGWWRLRQGDQLCPDCLARRERQRAGWRQQRPVRRLSPQLLAAARTSDLSYGAMAVAAGCLQDEIIGWFAGAEIRDRDLVSAERLARALGVPPSSAFSVERVRRAA